MVPSAGILFIRGTFINRGSRLVVHDVLEDKEDLLTEYENLQ